MKNDPIRELNGGLYLWQGKPWWLVFPKPWRAAQPSKLALRLLADCDDSPERLASLLGCQLFFPLTQGRLGKWSLELRKRHLSPEKLPDIRARLAWGDVLPYPIHPEAQDSAAAVWRRLAPLLGLDLASATLKTMLIPWQEWANRKPWHEIRLNAFKELFTKDREFKKSWGFLMPPERAQIFCDFMGPGRCQPEQLHEAAIIDDYQICLDLMSDLWCGRIRKPTSFGPRDYLALGLAFPGCDFGDCQLEENNIEKLLWNPDKISPEKLQIVVRNGVFRILPVEGIAQSILSGEELQYALDHGMELSIQGYQDPELSGHYFRLCRSLLEAGFPAPLLRHSQLLERSGNRAVFAYILMSQIDTELTPQQLKILDQLAPSGGFTEDWRKLPQVEPESLAELASLAETLELEQEQLLGYCRLRLALGKSLLSKRLAAWTPGVREEEVRNLQGLILAEPHRQELIKQLNRLRAASPDKNEKKRCAKEVRRGLDKLPQELWKAHLSKISDRLLRHILGRDIVEKAPRTGRLLHITDLPVEHLVLKRNQHPNNERWLQSFERAGFSAAHWLDGLKADILVDGKFIELRTETDPSEILEMGTHFETCLSLNDGFNAFSVLTNILEVNKMVLLGRNLEGKVMVRKLLAVTQKGQLFGYQTYSHLPGARGPVQEACHNFARKNGFTLVDKGEPERIIHELPWYDDGPETWILRDAPPNLPQDWPTDQAAIRQWNTQELSRGLQVPNFTFTRPVEVFHKILQGGKLDLELELAEDWYWDQGVERLAFLERFDLLQEHRVHKNASEMLYNLDQQSGLRPEFADDYVALFDPEHKLYKREKLHPNNVSSLELSGLWILADPKVIHKTCAGLARAGCLEPLDMLFEQLVEILILCFIRNPDDQAWHKFEEPALTKIMVEVGTRHTVEPWLDVYRRATEKHPDWEEAWLARARVEGANILPLLRNKLRLSRRSLPLALALDFAGEDPDDYILPRPKILCGCNYLNKARRLSKLIRPRLNRLESKGYSASELRFARKHLQTPDTLEWHSWVNDVSDSELDSELSKEVVNLGEFGRAGAWVRLGNPQLRLSILYHLGASLTDYQREILSVQNDGLVSRFRDVLVWHWLNPEKEVEGDFLTANILLAWLDWPQEVEEVLAKLDFPNFLEAFNEGAEFMPTDQLKTVFEQVIGGREYSFQDIADELGDPNYSVELQKLLLSRVQGEPPQGLAKTERGKWALQFWQSRVKVTSSK